MIAKGSSGFKINSKELAECCYFLYIWDILPDELKFLDSTNNSEVRSGPCFNSLLDVVSRPVPWSLSEGLTDLGIMQYEEKVNGENSG